MSIFEFDDYRKYLESRIEGPRKRSGFKTLLARACECNPAYISNIFKGTAHLSLEQAERASIFMHLTEVESHYFLVLVQKGRAGTEGLKKYFSKQLDQLVEQKLNVEKRLVPKDRLLKAHQAQYYSSWMYSAVHVALSVPRLAKNETLLANYLGLSLKSVRKTLEFLIVAGLAERSTNGSRIKAQHIHLGKNSEDIQKHHSNWRLQAMRAVENDNDQGLHYSSVVTLSKKDCLKVREIMLAAIKKSADLIMRSEEEEIFALGIDFFPMCRHGN